MVAISNFLTMWLPIEMDKDKIQPASLLLMISSSPADPAFPTMLPSKFSLSKPFGYGDHLTTMVVQKCWS